MMHSKKLETKQKLKTFSFEAIGTRWHIEYGGSNVAPNIEKNVLNRIELFDRVYSRFRDDSVITAMSKSPGVYVLPEDSIELFDFYEKLNSVTSGAVTPLVGNTLSDAGYDAAYSLRFKQKTPALDIANVYSRKQNVLTMNRAAILDLGAAGKGYLVDVVCAVLRSCGADSVMVNAGGDIAVSTKDNSSSQIALQHPRDTSLAIGVANVHNASICGSSIYLRDWGTHHHIIDPRTAESPRHIQAAWVYAKNTMLADGLSTAIFFTPAEMLSRHFDFEYAIMNADDSLSHSPDFPATFFE